MRYCRLWVSRAEGFVVEQIEGYDVMKDYLLYLLFGDKRRSALMLMAILFDYFMFNLI